MNKWVKVRFKTKSVEDYRPLKFNAKYPWWCSGEGDDYAIIIAWLPVEENLLDYWDDAYSIDSEEYEDIEFTDRFSKPSWFIS